MRRYGLALSALGTCAAAAAPAAAATITFQQGVAPAGTYQHVSQDFRGSGTTNNTAQTLVGYQTAGVLQIRTVMGFDLAAIPAGSTITGVSLRLVSDGNPSGTIAGVGAVNLHEVVPNGAPANNMVEGQITATQWRTGSPWTTTLGDFAPAPMSTAAVDNANANTLFDAGETATFASTPAFVAAAQGALNGGQPLEFILVAPQAEATTAASNFFRFRSDDFATTAADRPLLTVEYTPVPEPSAAAVGLLAGGAALAARRRSNRRPA